MYKFAYRSILGLLMAGIIPILGTSTAMAVPIDFADGSWNGAQGQTSFSSVVEGTTVGLTSLGGPITVNYNGGPSSDNSGRDGLGIGDDEITQSSPERLTISFDGPVTLQTVDFTDLFRNEGGIGLHEVGWYSINGGAYSSFAAAFGQINGLTNGLLTLNINALNVDSITFMANRDNYSDFSVRGLTYTASVPEPSTLIMLGFGFLIAAALYRRGYFQSV